MWWFGTALSKKDLEISGEVQERGAVNDAAKKSYEGCISRSRTSWRYIRGMICGKCQSKGTWSNGKGAHSFEGVVGLMSSTVHGDAGSSLAVSNHLLLFVSFLSLQASTCSL